MTIAFFGDFSSIYSFIVLASVAWLSLNKPSISGEYPVKLGMIGVPPILNISSS